MRTSVMTIFAAALLSASLATGKEKAVVQTTFKSKEDASQSISAILQRQGFRIEKTTSCKITAVFDPISTNLGPGDGQKPDFRGRDSADFRRGQRPQGGSGTDKPDRGQGGPVMGQGRPDFDKDADSPSITVKLKKTSSGIKATFVGDNIPARRNSDSDSRKGRRNGLARIVENVPNVGVTYK